MSHLRLRPIEKPIIVTSLTYNHRAEQNDYSSEASFLKLSQKNSEELVALNECSVFAEIQNRLNKLEIQSIQKIQDVQNKIKVHQRLQNKSPAHNNGLIPDRKEHESMTYRRLQRCVYNQDLFEQCIFQMDQNLNYVRDNPNEKSSNLLNIFIEAKQIHSQPKRQYPFMLKPIRTSEKGNKTNQSRRSSLYSKSQTSPAKLLQRERQSQPFSDTKRKQSYRSCKQSGVASSSRIYEQILSNYSTAKLLAMEKRRK